jgi:hypothetical protein
MALLLLVQTRVDEEYFLDSEGPVSLSPNI